MLWAAITDFRKRIIPDWIWIVILLNGGVSAFLLPYPTLAHRIVGFLLPGICLLILAVKYGGMAVLLALLILVIPEQEVLLISVLNALHLRCKEYDAKIVN